MRCYLTAKTNRECDFANETKFYGIKSNFQISKYKIQKTLNVRVYYVIYPYFFLNFYDYHWP